MSIKGSQEDYKYNRFKDTGLGDEALDDSGSFGEKKDRVTLLGKKFNPFQRTEKYLMITGAALVFIMVVFFMFKLLGGGDSKSDTVDPLKDKVSGLENRIMKLNGRMERMEMIESELEELQGVIERFKSREAEMSMHLDILKKKVAQLEKRKTPAPVVAKKKAPVQKKAAPVKNQGSGLTYHTVKKGDTFYSISRKYNIKLTELRRLNRLKEGAIIHPGDRLIVKK